MLLCLRHESNEFFTRQFYLLFFFLLFSKTQKKTEIFLQNKEWRKSSTIGNFQCSSWVIFLVFYYIFRVAGHTQNQKKNQKDSKIFILCFLGTKKIYSYFFQDRKKIYFDHWSHEDFVKQRTKPLISRYIFLIFFLYICARERT